MKKRTANRTVRADPARERRERTNTAPAEQDMLAVLEDVETRRAYYMSFIDSFYCNGSEYTVMYKYDVDDGSHPDPEMVILRNEPGIGERVYKSIKDKRELQDAFDVFYDRFRERSGQAGSGDPGGAAV